MPPNERKGRVHTSTVTVAVLDDESNAHEWVRWSEVDMKFTKATGAGGQHRNKRDSCVVLTHRPTGISAMADGRDQHANRREAWKVLQDRVQQAERHETERALDATRKAMVGSGQRGDKVRTYRCQDDRVTDHRSGKCVRLQLVQAGNLGCLE